MQRTDHRLPEACDDVSAAVAPRHRWSRTWRIAWALPACMLVAAQPTSSATWVAAALLVASVLVLNADGLAPRR